MKSSNACKKIRIKAKIAVVDDHPIVRRGIIQLLADTDDLEICWEAGDARETLDKIQRCIPSLLLLDLFLRGSMSVDLIRDLRARFPDLPILVFSVQNEALFAERALHAGADGYVAKEDATRELLQGIYSLLQGGVFVSKNLVDRLRFKLVRASQGGSRTFVAKLSDRELQVLTLLGDGIGLRQMAEDLSLSVKTVETHCARIKRKLGLKDANDLVRYAAQWKIGLSGIPR